MEQLLFYLKTDWYPLFRNILDIGIVAFLVYRGLLVIKGTRASPMLAGLSAVVLLYFLATYAGLLTLAWLLGSFLSSLILVIVVIFQDEIRRALTKVGLHPFLRRNAKSLLDKSIEELSLVCGKLSKTKTGALIALPRDVGLEEVLEDAIPVDAILSKRLLLAIFNKESPLHDGAVVVEGDRIKAAGCVLPLSYNPDLDPNLGTRHRAALGLTERSDALVIIVSEETGGISLAREGRLIRNLDPALLRDSLYRFFTPRTTTDSGLYEESGS